MIFIGGACTVWAVNKHINEVNTEHDDKWKWWVEQNKKRCVLVWVSQVKRAGKTRTATEEQLQNWFICVRKRSSVCLCNTWMNVDIQTYTQNFQYIQFIHIHIYPEYHAWYIHWICNAHRQDTCSTHLRANIQVIMTIIWNRHANSFVSIALKGFKSHLVNEYNTY